MATFTNAWDETIPEDDLLSGLSEAGKIDQLIRQLKLDIGERISKFVPVGMVIKWPGQVVPYGFKECNGKSLLRTQYAHLFSIIGTEYGAVDGSHFNIPDLRGYFLRGWNNSRASGLYDPDALARTDRGDGTTGDHVGTKQEDENKAHTHTYYSQSSGSLYSFYFFPTNKQESGDTGYSGGSENTPKGIYTKYIIRTDNKIPSITDEDDDEYYSYVRTWNESVPVNSDYMGRMALEIRKLRVDVQELINNFFPPGMVIYWPSSICPDGYLELNGQAIDRTVYVDLFNEIGDMYGPGDGETTFNVPDMRGLFIRSDDGSNLGVIIDDDNKSHSHTYLDKPGSTGLGLKGPAQITNSGIFRYNYFTSDCPLRTVDSHPKNIYLMACIKAKRCL